MSSCLTSHPAHSANILLDLNLKPVHFYCQFFTVLENGRSANLSIVKFVQVKGATSSFTRVIDTVESVLDNHNLIVTDPLRRKGIEDGVKAAAL